MIKEIVPLPKYFLALKVIFVTREHALPPTCFLIKKFDLSIISALWHVHAALKHSHIDFIAGAKMKADRLIDAEPLPHPVHHVGLHPLIFFL
jgi:hypothetical protein